MVINGRNSLSSGSSYRSIFTKLSWKSGFVASGMHRGVSDQCPAIWARRIRTFASLANTTYLWSPSVVFGGDQVPFTAQQGTIEIDSTNGIIQACFPGETKDDAHRRVQEQNQLNQQLVDLSGKYSSFSSVCISPGMIDVHTHISSLGRNWEGYTTATKAAAAGGITTIIGMPLNSLPPTISLDVVDQEWKAACESELHIDVGLWGGVLPETAYQDDQLCDLLSHPNVLGLKAFLSPLPLTAGYQAITPQQLLHVAQICGTFHKPILVHSELMSPDDVDRAVQFAFPDDGSLDDSHDAHIQSRPAKWEQDAVKVVIEATRYCDMHVVHLSDGVGCLPLVEQAKRSITQHRQRRRLTVETCPHYFLLDSDQVDDGDTRVKCFPPIREPSQREALWDGLQTGLIDMIASDHSPCEPSMRQHSIKHAWGGLTGLQYQLPATWTAARRKKQGAVSVCDMARWWSRNPARLASLHDRGCIEPGKKADLVVWDTEFVDRPDNYAKEHHRWAGDCYYSSIDLKGRVLETWLGGKEIYDGLEDRHISNRAGRYIEMS